MQEGNNSLKCQETESSDCLTLKVQCVAASVFKIKLVHREDRLHVNMKYSCIDYKSIGIKYLNAKVFKIKAI